MPMINASFDINRRDGKSLSLHRRAVPEEAPAEGSREPEQYQLLFDTPEYSYRVFVTNMKEPADLLVWFYNQRAGAENLIKEANNDAGLAAHPSSRWMMNCNHFQLAMLAYNLNCWLMLFNREEHAKVETPQHTTLATARLRFLFLAAKIWRHAGRVGVSNSDHYAEQEIFRRLMETPADDCWRRAGLRAGAGYATDGMNASVHRILCTGDLNNPKR